MKLPRSIGPSIESVARGAVGREWPLYAMLLDHWGEIVGPAYADQISIKKIAFPKGKKDTDKWAGGKPQGCVLTLAIPQGLSLEIGFMSDPILERINLIFGYKAVSGLKFEPYYTAPTKEVLNTPVGPRPILSEAAWGEQIKDIENKELKDALQKLGESVYREDPL